MKLGQTQSYKLRISQGIYKGITIDMQQNKYTRPTKALVKKSFFDTTRFVLQGSVFIECFAGSGQIALEALSLGASKVVLLEKKPEVFDCLMKNLHAFASRVSKNARLENPLSFIDSYNIDFLLSKDILATYLAPKINKELILKDDIITTSLVNANVYRKVIMYIDPPFDCREGFAYIYSRILEFLESFSDGMLDCVYMIIMETMTNAKLADAIGSFRLDRVATFGKTSLMYFIKD